MEVSGLAFIFSNHPKAAAQVKFVGSGQALLDDPPKACREPTGREAMLPIAIRRVRFWRDARGERHEIDALVGGQRVRATMVHSPALGLYVSIVGKTPEVGVSRNTLAQMLLDAIDAQFSGVEWGREQP